MRIIIAPGDKHTCEHDDAGQQHQRGAHAVDTKVQGYVKRRDVDPLIFFDELISLHIIHQVLQVDPAGEQQVHHCSCESYCTDFILPIGGHHQNEHAGNKRKEGDNT